MHDMKALRKRVLRAGDFVVVGGGVFGRLRPSIKASRGTLLLVNFKYLSYSSFVRPGSHLSRAAGFVRAISAFRLNRDLS